MRLNHEIWGVSWPSWPLLVQTSGTQAMRLAGTEATPLLHEVVMRGATGCCSWGKGRSGHRKGQGFMMVYSYFIDCWLAFTDAYRILWVFIVLNFKELICHLVRLPRSEEDERCSQARIFHDQCRRLVKTGDPMEPQDEAYEACCWYYPLVN